MRAVVMDASALAGFLLEGEHHQGVAGILRDEECEVFVPHLCDVEVASALRSAIARKRADVARATEALEFYRGLPLERVPHLSLLSRVLALRENFAAHDATYVALAEATGAPLHTADQRLARAVRAHTEVEVVEV